MFRLKYMADFQLFKVSVLKYSLNDSLNLLSEKDLCKNAALFNNDVLKSVTDSIVFYVEWNLQLILIFYDFTYKFKKSNQYDSILKLSDIYFRNVNRNAIGKYRNTYSQTRNVWYF